VAEDPIYTAAVHAGGDASDPHRSLSPPIYQSAAFAFSDAASGAAVHEGEVPGFFYGRMGTPTQAALEAALCELEGGEAALALASGMAAISTTLLGLLRPGDEVLAPWSLYTTTGLLLDDLLSPLGVGVISVDGGDPAAFAAAVTPRTALIYLETPSNPTLQLTDLAAVADIARRQGAVTVVDNTFATPVNQRPLDLGADLVVHSATKYLGGHGDLVAGVVVGRAALVERLRWHTAKLLGGALAPLVAWLVLRGVRTLPLRMARHNANAQRVAEALVGHRQVRQVFYPGLPTHPQHALAARQMKGFGGVVAFDLGDRGAAQRVVDSVRLCRRAVSLGDVATLVQHSASLTHAAAAPRRRQAAGIGEGLIRVSVGLERPEDILEDLERALDGRRDIER